MRAAARRSHRLPHRSACYRPAALVELPDLATDLALARVFVKDESFRLGLAAFKVLGASWAVARILAQRAGLSGAESLDMLRAAAQSHPITLVTATAGNHGRALARVAALLGLPARVYVPELLAGDARALSAADGAAVIVVSDTYDAAVGRAAASVANDHGAVLVQDTAWEGYEQIPGWIVQGYETLLVEIDVVALDRLPRAGPRGGPGWRRLPCPGRTHPLPQRAEDCPVRTQRRTRLGRMRSNEPVPRGLDHGRHCDRRDGGPELRNTIQSRLAHPAPRLGCSRCRHRHRCRAGKSRSVRARYPGRTERRGGAGRGSSSPHRPSDR